MGFKNKPCFALHTMQVDEPALREGLPLKRARWDSYLEWAVRAFRLSTVVAAPSTQIVTHLCYSEFADILPVRLYWPDFHLCKTLPCCQQGNPGHLAVLSRSSFSNTSSLLLPKDESREDSGA